MLTPILLADDGGASAQEGNLEITLTAYRPPFTRCANTPPPARPVSGACQAIIDSMDINNAETSFGARGVPGVRVELPMVLRRRAGCPGGAR